MPSRKSALKHMRSDEKKRSRNASVKSALRKLLKRFNSLVQRGDMEDAGKLLPSIASALDKAAKRRIIHKKKASRTKSRLSNKAAT